MDKSFLVKNFSQSRIQQELSSIGFDIFYLEFARYKYESNLYKIYDLTPVQATILKQIALSCKTDCAVHRDVLTHSIDKSDAILLATQAELEEIIKKLYVQPFGLKNLADTLKQFLNKNILSSLSIRNKVFAWNKTYIMGILNVTPNSFSDGGEFSDEASAISHFDTLVSDGADIMDIGAESTAPNSFPVSQQLEWKRLENIIVSCRKNIDIPISIDTRNSLTAQLALEQGVDIINDISGLTYDTKMGEVIARNNAYLVLTNNDIIEGNTLDSTIKSLIRRIDIANNVGISLEKIILDVGIGFNKTFEQNIELIRYADEICSLGYPVLYGISRKSFIQDITGLNPKETEDANISLASYLISKGVNILRVHDVKSHKIAFTALDRVLHD